MHCATCSYPYFRTATRFSTFACAIFLLALAGCGDDETATPADGDGDTPAAGLPPTPPPPQPGPPSTLPPVEWTELTRLPEIDGLDWPPDTLTTHRLLVLAVPLADFPILSQPPRHYRHAIFRDWSLSSRPAKPVGSAAGASAPTVVACRAAVSGTRGQLTLARQRNFTTGKTELAEATVLGDVPAIYLLFQIDRTATPYELRYQSKPLHGCPAGPAPALLNQLFLPVKPPGQWIQNVLDLGEHPLPCGDFGLLKKLVRKTELAGVDAQNQKITQQPAAGKCFVECHFAPRTAPFDFTAADWRMVLADSTVLTPAGVSANGGQGYHLGLTEGKGFAGNPTTLPVVLFEMPANGIPARLQYKTLSVTLPR